MRYAYLEMEKRAGRASGSIFDALAALHAIDDLLGLAACKTLARKPIRFRILGPLPRLGVVTLGDFSHQRTAAVETSVFTAQFGFQVLRATPFRLI